MGTAREDYRGFVSDGRRWDEVVHRPGDIVISTPSKAGTTWMQMLVALLVFDGPDLPAPLNELSPWLESTMRPLDEILTRLEAQEHRRFIKTHVPLDGLPLDDRVTYIVVGRDPRDVWVSMEHHGRHLDVERMQSLKQAASPDHVVDPDPVDWPDDPAEHFRFQLDLDRGRNPAAAHLAHVVHHLRTAWGRRHEPNVELFHYADLKADLPGQLMRLAAALDLDLDRARSEELAAAASLSAMRARAREMAPEATIGVWQDPSVFFRRGGSGEWRDRLRPGDAEHYERRVEELTGGDHDLATWIHGGWGALSRDHDEVAPSV